MLKIILYVLLGCSVLIAIGIIYALATSDDKKKHENTRLLLLIAGLFLIVISLAFYELETVLIIALVYFVAMYVSYTEQEDEEEALKKHKEKEKQELVKEFIKQNPSKELTPKQKKENEEFMKNLRDEVRQLEKKKRQQEGSFWIWEKGYWKKD